MGIGEAILSGVISLVALCSGAAIWEVAKEEKQNRIFATQLWEGITEPSPWENPISPVAEKHLTGFESEKQLRYPDEVMRDELYTLDTLDTQPPLPLPTPVRTDERTQPGTGMPTRGTHESIASQAVECGGDTSGEPGGGGDGGAVATFIGRVLPAPKKGYSLEPDDVTRKGKAYYLIQSALLIDPNMEKLSQNWFLREVFKVSKNSKGHETFKQLLAKVRSDLNV